ncbi:MAG: AAA domain-containing protein [Caldisericia bacterium]
MESFVRAALDELCGALDQEIAAERSGHTRTKIPLADGRLLGLGGGNDLLYSFACYADVNLPDESPVQLVAGSRTVHGTLISSEQEAVTVAVGEDLGSLIDSADMVPSPWELLEKLKERLQELPSRSDDGLLSQSLALQKPWRGSAAYVSGAVTAQLNAGQQDAIALCLSNDVSFIWGPPGTGKSMTVGRLVQQLVLSGRRVLVTAHSNAAVDVAMLDVVEACGSLRELKNGRILRYGYVSKDELRQHADVIPLEVLARSSSVARDIKTCRERRRALLSGVVSERRRLTDREAAELRTLRETVAQRMPAYLQEEDRLVDRAQVVGCTLAKFSISPALLEKGFDTVIVDEASMSLVPYVALAASRAATHLVLAGDFMQLPPIAVSEEPLAQRWIQRDVWRVHGIPDAVRARRLPPGVAVLTTQYRMHPALCVTVSDMFYQSRLQSADGVRERTAPLARLGIFPGHSICAVDTGPLAPRCYKEGDVGTSRLSLVDAIVAVCVAAHATAGGSGRVAVITPYAAQARLMRTMARELGFADDRMSVSTVHRFQGSEQDVVVFVPAEGYPQPRIGYLSDMRAFDTESIAARLLNVAISRARGKVILVGDATYISQRLTTNAPLRQLFAAAQDQDAMLSATAYALRQRGLLPQQLSEDRIDFIDGEGFLLRQQTEKSCPSPHSYVMAYLPADVAVPDAWRALAASSGPDTVLSYGGQARFDRLIAEFTGGHRNWGGSRCCESLLCLDGQHLLLEGVFGQEYGTRHARIVLHMPKTISVYLLHSGLGPTRELGDVMRRARPAEQDQTEPRRRTREKKRPERAPEKVRSANRGAAAGARFVPSPCPDCGGRRELRADVDGLHTECMQCHTIEPATLASLYGIVEKMGVRCRSCGWRMEARWGRAGRYYLCCQGSCQNTVTADALREWIQDGIQPENVYVGSRSH